MSSQLVMGFIGYEWSLTTQKKVLRDPEIGVTHGPGQDQVAKGHHIHMMHNGHATYVLGSL